MSTATFESEITIVIDGTPYDLGPVELPVGHHMQMQLAIVDAGPCGCEEPTPPTPAKSYTVSSEVELEALPASTVIADKDHDDWEKLITGEWVHKGGPHMRSKTLAALWAPFTIVHIPEVGIAA